MKVKVIRTAVNYMCLSGGNFRSTNVIRKHSYEAATDVLSRD